MSDLTRLMVSANKVIELSQTTNWVEPILLADEPRRGAWPEAESRTARMRPLAGSGDASSDSFADELRRRGLPAGCGTQRPRGPGDAPLVRGCLGAVGDIMSEGPAVGTPRATD